MSVGFKQIEKMRMIKTAPSPPLQEALCLTSKHDGT
jgi:hypothetical protein